MDFFKYNIRPLLVLIVIAIVGYCIARQLRYATGLNAGAILAMEAIVVLLIVIIGSTNFYARRRILFREGGNTILTAIGKGTYDVFIKYSGSDFRFAEEKLRTQLSGYPVEIGVYFGRGYDGIEFRFPVQKTTGIYEGTTRDEVLLVGRSSENIPGEVSEFVAQMIANKDQPAEL